MIDIRLFHLAEELAGVRGQRFDVAALTFRVNGVESQRRFARSGESGKDDQFVPGNFKRYVFQVVLTRTFNLD